MAETRLLQPRAAVLVLIVWLLLFPIPSQLWRRRRRRRKHTSVVAENREEDKSCGTARGTSNLPIPLPASDITDVLALIAASIVIVVSASITFLSIKFYRFRRTTHLRFADRGLGVVIAVSRKCDSTSNVYCRDVDEDGSGNGKPFQLIKFENRTFWTNEEVTNERLKVGSLLNYQRDVSCSQILSKLGELDGKKFIEIAGGETQDIVKILMDLQDDESVYNGLKEVPANVNSKVHRFQAFLEKLYLHMPCTEIYLIGVRACKIKNERVTLETMDGEWSEVMPLNCRKSLVLSTAPVNLQLERPWMIADKDATPGVAVVIFEAHKFTCEGLILRCEPYIISRAEEPVEILNGNGELIPVPKGYGVLFDTGNEAATGISTELLSKLNLQPNPNEKMKVKSTGGGSAQYETVEIKLKIQQNIFKVHNALVGAPAEGTDLLVGMDIIQKLFDLGYTIGD